MAGKFLRDAHSDTSARDQLLQLWEQLQCKEFWALLGDFNLEVDEAREWLAIASPGAVFVDVGPICFGGGGAPSIIDYGTSSKSVRFSQGGRGVSGCLACLFIDR